MKKKHKKLLKAFNKLSAEVDQIGTNELANNKEFYKTSFELIKCREQNEELNKEIMALRSQNLLLIAANEQLSQLLND